LSASIERVLRVRFRIIDIVGPREGVLDHWYALTCQHALIDDARTREQSDIARHAAVLRDLDDIAWDKF
jgi:hypothetical protein